LPTTSTPVLPLPIAVIEPPFQTLLVASVGASPLLPAGLCAAPAAAIAMSSIAVGTDEKHGVALLAKTDSLKENRFAVNLRHASSQAGLDNGTHFVAGWNHLCLVYLTKVAELEPCRFQRQGSLASRLINTIACLMMMGRMTAPTARMMSLFRREVQKTTFSDDR
jgi:hypothetical protein